jgi:DNA-binding LacI/PurR family transcriptional regulator
MAVTSKDIARELKLSQPTVSRILSGDPKHRASFATRERVLRAAEQLGYRPNAVARSLRKGRTDVVGLYNAKGGEAAEDVEATVVSALRRQCAARKLDLLLYSAIDGYSPGDMLAKVNDGRVDGLIVYGTTDDPLIEIAGRSAIPVAAIVDPIPHLFSITFDDGTGMDALISHFWWRGYRRFVFVAPDYRAPGAERLLAAFRSEMDRRCVREEYRRVRRVSAAELGSLADELSTAGERIAVCCWNDIVAYNLRLTCLSKGIDVPERIAVSGFGGYLPGALSAGVLSMRCDWDQIACAALDWMMDRVNGKGGIPDYRRELRMPLAIANAEAV